MPSICVIDDTTSPSPIMVKCNKWTPAPVSFKFPEDPTPKADLTPFPFLSLPRELRDQVYSYCLPHTLKYRQPSSKATAWWESPPRLVEQLPHLSIFLACRQLHDEASETLWRTCSIVLPTRYPPRRNHRLGTKHFQHDERLPLHLTLSSFPSSAARMVTRVSKQYQEHTPRYRDMWLLAAKQQIEVDEAFAMWTHIVSESLILRDYFPRLRSFEVECNAFQRQVTDRWWCRVDGLNPNGLDPLWTESERRKKVETVAHVLVSWLRSCGEGKACVPPVWLSIRFDWMKQVRETDKFGMKVLEDGLTLAHRLFAKKTPSREEMEASGRVWLEGLSETRKRGRKGWCDGFDF
ncbi:hypothetical protein E8E11_007232 [Didymella keratinophila]|nr:hypothetical protein E8E11_007232 [Didymella keratinophila]